MNENTQEFLYASPQSGDRARPSFLCMLIEKISRLVISKARTKAVPRARRQLSLITGIPTNDPQIDTLAGSICQNLIHSYIELFFSLARGSERLSEKIDIDQRGLTQLQRELGRGRGVVLAGTHTCGFDQVVFGLTQVLPGIQILSKARPTGGSLLMYLLRKLHKVCITPISVSALRQAIGRLQAGGVVAIAIDLPVPNGARCVFFDQECLLTDAHSRMALKSGSKIFLVYTLRTPSGRYQVKLQEVRQPSSCPSEKALVQAWAQETYRLLEQYIRRWPDAWYGTTFELFSEPSSSASYTQAALSAE